MTRSTWRERERERGLMVSRSLDNVVVVREELVGNYSFFVRLLCSLLVLVLMVSCSASERLG